MADDGWWGKNASGGKVTLDQFKRSFDTFVRSQPSKLIWKYYCKEMHDIVKKMYMERAWFKTGAIVRDLTERLKITDKTFSMVIPPFPPTKSAFHWQETGFTTRSGRRIKGRYFFRDIKEDAKLMFLETANKVATKVMEKVAKKGVCTEAEIATIVNKEFKRLSKKIVPRNALIKKRNVRRMGDATETKKTRRKPGAGARSRAADKRIASRKKNKGE